MAAVWTTPRTWALSDFADADMLNTHIRNNFDWLKSPAGATATGSTDITTTSGLADMTSLTGSFTLVGSRCIVAYKGPLRASGGTVVAQMAVNIDAVVQTYAESIASGAQEPAAWIVRVGSLTAGVKSINVQWGRNANTLAQDGATYASRFFFASECD